MVAERVIGLKLSLGDVNIFVSSTVMLVGLIRSNTFGIVQKIARWIKLPSLDVDTVQ